MYPLVWWSVAESANATQRLLAAIVRWDVQSVVPGHGPILSADDALAIGHADIGYFRELEQAAQSASMRGVSYADAVYGILEVEPPRPSDPDIEFLAPGLLNATRALSEVGIEPPPANPAPWDYLTGSSWSAANQEG